MVSRAEGKMSSNMITQNESENKRPYEVGWQVCLDNEGLSDGFRIGPIEEVHDGYLMVRKRNGEVARFENDEVRRYT
jgi:hypothetical protein